MAIRGKMEAIGLVCLYGLAAIDDIRTNKVKVLEIIFFGIIGIVFNLVYKPYSLINVLGGVMVGVMVLIVSIFSKEKIGKGDSFIIMVTGLFLGFKDTITLLWLSTVLAAIVGMIFIKKHRLSPDYELPFVPFMLMGYLLLNTVNTIGGLVVCG